MADYFGKKLSDAQKASDFAKKVLEVQARGQVEKGNIDLASRPGVKNPDGSESTVRSMSFSDGKGREVLIPTVVNGKVVSDDEAIANYRRTGQHMGVFSNPQDATAYAQKVHGDHENGKYGSNVKVNEPVYRPAAKSLTPGQGYPRQEKQETEQERFDRHMPARRAAFPPEDFGALRQPSYVQEAKFSNDMLMPSSETLGKLHEVVPEAIRNAMGQKLEAAKAYARSVGVTSHGAALANKTEELTKPTLQKYLDHVATPIANKLSGYEPPEIEFDVTPPTVIPETTVTGNSLSARIGRVMGMGGTEGAPRLRQPRTPEVIAGRSMERDRSGARYDQMVDADRGTKLGLVDTGPEQEDAYKKDPEYEARKAGVKEYGGVSGDVTRKNPQADRKVVQTAFDRAVKKGQ